MNNQIPLVMSLLFIVTFLLSPFFPIAADPTSQDNSTNYIRTSCSTTSYPEICLNSLSSYANTIKQSPARLAHASIVVTLAKARQLAAYMSEISKSDQFGPDPLASTAINDCISNIGDALEHIQGSLKEIQQTNVGTTSPESSQLQISNAQTWMSAALTNEETCIDGFNDVAEVALKAAVSERTSEVKKFTSNALALLNSYARQTKP